MKKTSKSENRRRFLQVMSGSWTTDASGDATNFLLEDIMNKEIQFQVEESLRKKQLREDINQ